MPVNISISLRQTYMLHLVACGFSNREIARRMGLREASVKNYIYSLYRSLGLPVDRDLNKRVALVTYYLQEIRGVPVVQAIPNLMEIWEGESD